MALQLGRLKITRDIAVIGLCIIVLGVVLLQPWRSRRGERQISLKHTNFSVRLASTPAEHAKGLSDTSRLKPHEGMLFTFQPPEAACFWMKDMHYNLDILWFDAQRKLIYQEWNASPDTYPANFCPEKVANYVLEIPGGTARQLKLQLGDQLQLRD